MKILFITIAFAPTEFSESIVNSKLVLALKEAGHEVDVISRGKNGPSYSDQWNEPWLSLKDNTCQVDYETGDTLTRNLDLIRCGLRFMYPLDGVRWASRAFDLALKLHRKKNYDVVITRSPADISHIVGLKLKKETSMRWIANWNDPANDIWPAPYETNLTKAKLLISHFYTQKVLKTADYNTFPSERLRTHFLRYYRFDMKKAAVIPHISLRIEAGEIRRTGNTPGLTICHAGNLSVERDPEILFKAMAQIKAETGRSPVTLTVIGEINKHVAGLVIRYALENEVIFEKGKPYIETQKLLSSFDILCVLESRMNEGIFLPSKVSDYCILLKPILCISPPTGTLRDLFNEYGGGLVADNENEESVYLALKKLIGLKESNALQSSFPMKKMVDYHSPSTIIPLYNHLFHSIKATNS